MENGQRIQQKIWDTTTGSVILCYMICQMNLAKSILYFFSYVFLCQK